MTRILRNLVFGAIGGFLGWAIIEPNGYLRPPDDPAVPYPAAAFLLFGCIAGAAIGLCIGLSEGIAAGSYRMVRRSAALGTATGVAGGLIGLMFGQAVYGPMATSANRAPLFVGFVMHLIARSLGWSLVGLCIGFSQGLPSFSTKRMRNGAIGGFLGGAAGGAAFEVLGQLNSFRLTQALIYPGWMLRFVGLTITGASIGLFIGFVEELLKQAWIVKLSGAGEGRQFIISKPVSTLGRSELADVPVFGDSSVAPLHAVLRLQDGRYAIEDQGAPAGVIVNGQPVNAVVLKDGDIIQVGGTRLGFREKATARRFAPPPDLEEAVQPRIPTSDRICPFCGGIKDARGNCACAVGGVAQTVETGQAGASQAAPAPQAELTPSASYRLTGVSGPYAGQSFELPASGEVSIGREADRDISLPADNTASRKHARFIITAGGVVLIDEGSLNGTYVNDQRISQHTLVEGDLVQIGNTKFRFGRQ